MSLLVIGVVVLTIALIFFLLYLNAQSIKKNAMYKSDKRLDQKTVLITGGTAGIGLEVAKDLAKRGARVIIACPYMKEGIESRNHIIQISGNENVIFELLDLACFQSVREFANKILNNEDKLEFLINNAGIRHTNAVTKDGLNITLQINYFGHFLLTILLLPLLMKSGTSKDKARIINVSSILQPPFMNLKYLNKNHIILRSTIMYPRSKLCLLLFANELTRRLTGTNVVVNSVNPGAAGTAFFDRYSMVLVNIFYKTVVEAAQVYLYATLDEEAGKSSGLFFRDNKVVKARSIAYNTNLARELWDLSVKIVKLEDNPFVNNVEYKQHLEPNAGELNHVSCHV